MQLETLKSDLFQTLSVNEAAMVKGGRAAADGTQQTVWSNTFIDGVYVGNDKDIFTDPAPAPAPAEPILVAGDASIR